MLRNISRSPNYKWWVFGTVAVGTFLSVVDHGSVLVALPEIEKHFGTDLPTVQWVVLGYALAISVLLLPMSRLGDIVGRKPVYITGFAIFTMGSLGVEPRLDAVSPQVAGAFVAGLHRAFFLMGGFLLLAAVVVLARGERQTEATQATPPGALSYDRSHF